MMRGQFAVKIKRLQYQRNGIAGEPFYQAIVGAGRKQPNMIVTFKTVNEDPQSGGHDDWRVDIGSVRVTDPKHFNEAWRGDDFGESIQDALDKLKFKFKVETVYDVMEHLGGGWKARSGRKKSEEKMF